MRFPLQVDLCGMTQRYFSRALQNQKDHVLTKVSEDDIEDIIAQFRRLRIAYQEETGLKATLDAVHSQATL